MYDVAFDDIVAASPPCTNSRHSSAPQRSSSVSVFHRRPLSRRAIEQDAPSTLARWTGPDTLIYRVSTVFSVTVAAVHLPYNRISVGICGQ